MTKGGSSLPPFSCSLQNFDSKIQQLLRDIDHIAARAINRGSRLAFQHGPQIEDLGLVFPLHDANEGHFFEVCLRSKSTGLHDGFKHGSRSFEYDFSWFLHGSRDNDWHGPAFQSNQDFIILKLRFVESSQLTLQLPGTFPRSMNFPNQREAKCSVRSNLLRLVELRRCRKRYFDDISSRQIRLFPPRRYADTPIRLRLSPLPTTDRRRLLYEVSHRPLNLRLGVYQEVRARNDAFTLLQTAGDLIVAFLVRVVGYANLPASFNEARLQFSGSLVQKDQHSRAEREDCINRDREPFPGVNFRNDIGKHPRPQLPIGVRNIDADRGGTFDRINRRADSTDFSVECLVRNGGHRHSDRFALPQ